MSEYKENAVPRINNETIQGRHDRELKELQARETERDNLIAKLERRVTQQDNIIKQLLGFIETAADRLNKLENGRK